MGKQTIHKAVSKKFLNDAVDENGAICFNVEAMRYTSVPKDEECFAPYMVDATLRIQDCSRPIYLEFGFTDDEDSNGFEEDRRFEDRLDKIQVMIDSLVEMRNHMRAANDIMLEQNIKIREAAKAAKETSTNDDDEKEVSEDGR